MIKLIVKLCLTLNPYLCLAPIVVMPTDGEITSITSCMMGGAIFITMNGAEYTGKVYCSQGPETTPRAYLRNKYGR
jgi:hypothetical protein